MRPGCCAATPPADVGHHPLRLHLLAQHRGRQQAPQVQPVALQLAEGQTFVVLQASSTGRKEKRGRLRSVATATVTATRQLRKPRPHEVPGADHIPNTQLSRQCSKGPTKAHHSPAPTRASRMRSTPLITLRTQGVVGREWSSSSCQRQWNICQP